MDRVNKSHIASAQGSSVYLHSRSALLALPEWLALPLPSLLPLALPKPSSLLALPEWLALPLPSSLPLPLAAPLPLPLPLAEPLLSGEKEIHWKESGQCDWSCDQESLCNVPGAVGGVRAWRCVAVEGHVAVAWKEGEGGSESLCLYVKADRNGTSFPGSLIRDHRTHRCR